MLYLSIDQHSKQLTVSVRNPAGETVMRRQVSTRPEKIAAFFDELMALDPHFMAILEVCGFNDWLIATLQKYSCREIVLIHPDKTSKQKTDRRDANTLCELLWLNRERLRAGQPVQGLRRVTLPSPQEQDDRQLTSLRKRMAQQRTRTLNQIHRILHRRNRMWDYPTKTFQTKSGRQWLETVSLPPIDRLELNLLLAQWKLYDEQIEQLDQQIVTRASQACEGKSPSPVHLLMTVPGVSHYSALALASRIGSIERFARPRSLANYFGLTPGCRNSGNRQHRLGSITKEGSTMVRFLLGQLVIHVLKRDAKMRTWYQQIKRRRGSKIARVAVMRRLTNTFWHLLTHQEPYQVGGRRRKEDQSASASPETPSNRAQPQSGKSKNGQSTKSSSGNHHPPVKGRGSRLPAARLPQTC